MSTAEKHAYHEVVEELAAMAARLKALSDGAFAQTPNDHSDYRIRAILHTEMDAAHTSVERAIREISGVLSA